MSLAYLYIFLQSNLIEVPFYYWILRRSETSSESWLRFLVLVTAVNSLTHPIVFFVIMNLKLTYLQNILLAETFAILSEAIFFMYVLRQSWSRSFSASFVANLMSWQLAPMLTYVIWR